MKNFISSNSPFLITDTRLKRWAIPYHHECVNARIDILLDKNRKFIKDKSILDIGSHIGLCSIPISLYCNVEKIFAFEPNEVNRRIFTE